MGKKATRGSWREQEQNSREDCQDPTSLSKSGGSELLNILISGLEGLQGILLSRPPPNGPWRSV